MIIGRAAFPIDCSVCTLYRMFRTGVFHLSHLPMKDEWDPNGHQEKQGKQMFRRSIHEWKSDYSHYSEAFGHLERDMIVGLNHKSAVIPLEVLITGVQDKLVSNNDIFVWYKNLVKKGANAFIYVNENAG